MKSPRVKICGLTRRQDADLAARLGAWATGFIFYASSPRLVKPELVKSIIEDLPTEVEKVGVFVDSSLTEILKMVDGSRITAIQLHGTETAEFCANLKSKLPDHRLIKAIRIQNANDLKSLEKFSLCDAVLLDSYLAGPALGGTGQSFDWKLSQHVQPNLNLRLIIAGGLKPSNVLGAVRQFQPYAVDVSSGVEFRPGIKDEVKLRDFFSTLKAVV